MPNTFDWSAVGGTPINTGSAFDWSAVGGKEVSAPSRGLGKSALRQAGRLGRSAATGIAGLADIPNLAALGLHSAGLKESPTFYEPIAGRVEKGIDTLTGGRLKPENPARTTRNTKHVWRQQRRKRNFKAVKL